MRLISCLVIALVVSSRACGQSEASASQIARGTLLESGEIHTGPDPDDPEHLLRLLADVQVSSALGLGPDITDPAIGAVKSLDNELQSFLRSNRNKLTQEEIVLIQSAQREKVESLLSEILTPDRHTRLRQLAHRIGISTLGWENAITNGRLASRVGVHEGQKEGLYRKTKRLVAKMEAEIAEARKKTENEILDLLSPEQRASAKELLGEFFQYRQLSQAEEVAKRLLAKRAELFDSELEAR